MPDGCLLANVVKILGTALSSDAASCTLSWIYSILVSHGAAEALLVDIEL
eukprot:SAG31_NODE_6180_length_2135_cov_1.055010_3_plen_50_part_00